MKSEAEIDALMTTAVEAGLDGLDFMARFTYEQLAAGYNGCGPEWMLGECRDKLTVYLAVFEPAFLIHDMRTEKSDGSRERFAEANNELLRNCLALADHAYPWYSWRRYRAHAAAFAIFEACDSQLGFVAWRLAAEKNFQP